MPTKSKSSTVKKPARPSAAAAANVAALMAAPASDVPAVDPSEVEFQAEEAAAAEETAEEGTGEEVAEQPKRRTPGSWMKAQQPPPKPKTAADGYQLISLAKPRRVLAENIPAEVVKFEHDNEGHKILVFDGIRCPRGVVTFHGQRAFLNGGPKASPQAAEIAAIRARLAELEARPVGQFGAEDES